MKPVELRFLLHQAVDPSDPRNLDRDERRLLGFGDRRYPGEGRDDVRDAAIGLLAEVLATRGEEA